MKEKKNELKIGDRYEVTKDGSLGLMALGYKGVMKWRNRIIYNKESTEIIGPIFNGKVLKVFTTNSVKKDEKK